MARMTLTTGSCPICGRNVARTVTALHGLAMESYHCPTHGRRESSPHAATVADWVVAPSMASLGEMMQMPVPIGVDWVR